MNAFKKTGGFTLVELIIVIAILAILSSIAVAGYSSYIKKANDSAVESLAANIKTHATLANAQAGAIKSVTFTYDKATNKVTVKITADLFDDDFDDDFKKAYTGADWAGYDEDGTATNTLSEIAYYQFTMDAGSAWAGSNYNKTGAQTIPSEN